MSELCCSVWWWLRLCSCNVLATAVELPAYTGPGMSCILYATRSFSGHAETKLPTRNAPLNVRRDQAASQQIAKLADFVSNNNHCSECRLGLVAFVRKAEARKAKANQIDPPKMPSKGTGALGEECVGFSGAEHGAWGTWVLSTVPQVVCLGAEHGMWTPCAPSSMCVRFSEELQSCFHRRLARGWLFPDRLLCEGAVVRSSGLQTALIMLKSAIEFPLMASHCHGGVWVCVRSTHAPACTQDHGTPGGGMFHTCALSQTGSATPLKWEANSLSCLMQIKFETRKE
eukprot:1148455-Pelagomonas_calceolata.AAC.5